MPYTTYKPTSPGRRLMSVSSFEEITRSRPERSLLAKKISKAGRNNQGRITVAAPWRRRQAPLPHHRLQAQQARRAGEGLLDRV